MSDWEKLYNAAKRSRDDMALDVAHHAKQRAEAEKKLAEAERKIERLIENRDAHLAGEIAYENMAHDLKKERDALRAALTDVRKGIIEHAEDTVWVSWIETAVDRIDAALTAHREG